MYAPSDDVTEEPVITPAHFLIGESFILPPPIEIAKDSNYSLQRIRQEQVQMLESFWKRWQSDYLSTLLPRKKWLQEKENIKLGQVVLIQDDNLPPAKWKIAKVSKLLTIQDGFVRNVVLELADRNKPKKNKIQGQRKTLTRAVQRLCILPSEPSCFLQNDTNAEVNPKS